MWRLKNRKQVLKYNYLIWFSLYLKYSVWDDACFVLVKVCLCSSCCWGSSSLHWICFSPTEHVGLLATCILAVCFIVCSRFHTQHMHVVHVRYAYESDQLKLIAGHGALANLHAFMLFDSVVARWSESCCGIFYACFGVRWQTYAGVFRSACPPCGRELQV